MIRKSLAVAALATIAVAGTAQARDQIRIVGSSTVYPFTTTVAEQFGKTTPFKTPVIESTGTGGGFKLFCAGVGVQHPDITNASRAIKKSEVDDCTKNGIKDLVEVKVGYDGIVMANAKSAPQIDITTKQMFLALAKDIPDGKGGLKPNDNMKWSDVDPSLPDVRIEVLGPPPTSGTRDAFAELALESGCNEFDFIKAWAKSDSSKHKAVCHSVREDGGYVEAGENDVLIVRKIEANPNAFGVFGFSFLEQNLDKIQGSKVNGVVPEFETIASGDYPVSRPLFFYVKKAHAEVIPGIKEFLAEFTSEKAWGPDGYLSDKGLIPMPDAERAKFRSDAMNLTANVMM
ncbi:MAG: PstS family phosphate ABC transporter substrate-binding protein [Rhodospirillales bacterium]